MDKLMKAYIDQVTEYLNTPIARRDIEKGAMLMLKGNRNRVLYQNVLRRNLTDKIEYELGKIVENYKVRIIQTVSNQENITELEVKVYNVAKSVQRTGKRPDHDQLPAQIQNLVEANVELYHQMRSLHEKLKIFNGENYDADMRKPLLTQLLKFDEMANENWNTYDRFDPSKPIVIAEKSDRKLDVQEVQKYRTALSRAVNEIPDKIKKGKISQADNQLFKAQQCYDLLKKDGQNFTPAMLENMKNVKINL